MNNWFTRFATRVSRYAGRSWAFAAACLIVAVWLPTYFIVRDLNTWQLIINTFTTIVTFLLVVLLENTSNRDFLAVQIKLDMLLKKAEIDTHKMMNLEDRSDLELEEIISDIDSEPVD